MPIDQQTAEEAYKVVLAKASATLPKRDAVDSRIIEETRGGFATYEGEAYKKDHKDAEPNKASGIIDSQNDVGGWPKLKSKRAPKDTDHDGMPDYWEDKNNLDKENAADRNTMSSDGYTTLEKYLNNSSC